MNFLSAGVDVGINASHISRENGSGIEARV